jgi:hypothetical protein
MGDNWQRVRTYSDWYDGPRSGIADFDGIPHFYHRQFDLDEDEYSDCFELTPLEPSLLALLLESQEIWLRWQAAFELGQVDITSHPALPAERSRYHELKAMIDSGLAGKRSSSVVKRATFKIEPGEVRVIWRDAN